MCMRFSIRKHLKRDSYHSNLEQAYVVMYSGYYTFLINCLSSMNFYQTEKYKSHHSVLYMKLANYNGQYECNLASAAYQALKLLQSDWYQMGITICCKVSEQLAAD